MNNIGMLNKRRFKKIMKMFKMHLKMGKIKWKK